MQFVFPGFLWSLALLSVPIIIHLFYFRRAKKVYFTNVRFLKAVQEEQSARSRLRNLLILAMRLLALAALILAFAQPFIASKNSANKGRRAISLFVDNSYSMNARSSDVPLIELAKTAAREIVQAYQADDRFQVLTHDLEGRHMRLVDKQAALQLIDEIRSSPNVSNISQVVQRQKHVLQQDDSPVKTAFVISDFQRSISDLGAIRDTNTDLRLIPLGDFAEQNVSIDTCYFEAPVPVRKQINKLIVKVHNWNDEAAEDLRLSLDFDGAEKPVGSLSIPPRSSRIDTINFTFDKAGLQQVKVKITDFPIQFDDTWYLAFNSPDKFKVLQIHDDSPNRNLSAALRGIPAFAATEQAVNSLNYSGFGENQLIVLDGIKAPSSGLAAELGKYLQSGGNLLIFPALNADINAYNSFLAALEAGAIGPLNNSPRQVGNLNKESYVFRDIFENKQANLRLPSAAQSYPLKLAATRGAEILMRFREGDPYLVKYRKGPGQCFLCSAALDDQASDLVRNAEIFVPMLYKMALSKGVANPSSYVIGQDESLEADAPAGNAEIFYKIKGKETFIPGQNRVGNRIHLQLKKQIRDAGFYTLIGQEDQPVNTFAFNYDRRESDLSCFKADELESQLSPNMQIVESASMANLASLLGEQDQGKPLWRYCIWLCLAALLAEVLLIRFWKT